MLSVRRTIASLPFFLLLNSSCNSPDLYEDAIGHWSFADTNKQTEIPLTTTGSVQYDGKSVYLNGASWLNAGQGNNDELNITGKAITLFARFKPDSLKEFNPILTKSGNDQQGAYSIALSKKEQNVYTEVMIGSDDIGGSHLLKYQLPENEISHWQEVLFRFNGKTSELYVNGILRDKEVTVGEIRDWNTRPVLIGAQYDQPYVANDSTTNKIEGTFNGWIDRIAIWNKYLSDDKAAALLDVRTLNKDGLPNYYQEKHRPQFHFTAKKNWINDPNGLVYYNGEYHLFFQYMPPHRHGAYKDWGHATSKDLIHWTQDDQHITPHKVWGGCWSGSAVVDKNNVSGFQTGTEKPIIAFITNGGSPADGFGPLCTQTIAYSTNGAKTFTYYDQNPVIKNINGANRDPKVTWDEQSQKWIMSLFLDKGYEFALFGSTNLRNWEHLSNISFDRIAECPGFEPFALDGNKQNIKWVFNGASGNYVVGSFDGKIFKPETGTLIGDYGSNFYAPQIWSDEPNGRKIQIAWMPTNRFPGMPFEQQMNFPTELHLKSTSEGMRIFRLPVAEIKKLYNAEVSWQKQLNQQSENPLTELKGELYDMTLELDMRKAAGFEIGIRGATIRYDVQKQKIRIGGPAEVSGFPPDNWKAYVKKHTDQTNNMGEAKLTPVDGGIKLRILVDRTTMEVFANEGQVVFSSCFKPDEKKWYSLSVNGEADIKASIHSLKSAWAQKQ